MLYFSFNGEEAAGHGSEQNRKTTSLLLPGFLELPTDGKLEEKMGNMRSVKNMERREFR